MPNKEKAAILRPKHAIKRPTGNYQNMKKILLTIFLGLLLLGLILCYNTWTFQSKQLQVAAIPPSPIPIGAVDRFIEALSIRTVSFEDEADFDSTQFRQFNQFLVANYPLVQKQLDHKIFNEFSHLYKWKGKQARQPIVLMGHIDVVPIASPRAWTVHPFTEGIKNDTIYGRGTMDDKIGVIGILEAVEQLLGEGFQPDRDIYLAFGHDEEVSGPRGAVPIANYLEELGVEAAFVLDEGQAIIKDLIPGITQKTALIGIAEKGYLTLELAIGMVGGHSSSPAKETAIDVLSNAIYQLKQNPMPASINPVLARFMDKLGPEMDFSAKLAFSNRWLFSSVLLDEYAKTNSGNANIRTTTSPTIFEAGIKENVIPTTARAIVNFRIIPGETVEDVIAHVTTTINDERIQVEVVGQAFNPSPVSATENAEYELVERSIKEVFPAILSSPSLVIGATDARHFSAISKNVYRFSPFHITAKNLTCFHGIDERVGKSEFENGIRFYRRLIENGGDFKDVRM